MRYQIRLQGIQSKKLLKLISKSKIKLVSKTQLT